MDWLDSCPDDFRERLKKLLDFPPGTPGSEAVYDYILLNEFKDFKEDYEEFELEDFNTDLPYHIEKKQEEEFRSMNPAALDLDLSDPKLRAFRRYARRKYAEAWGEYAEALVAQKILKEGLPICEWNWSPGANRNKKRGSKGRHHKGEIDLITQKDNRYIFIEVKARCGRFNDPMAAIDDKKIRRLCRGADTYINMQPHSFEYQFDLALITGSYRDYSLEYIPDAFLAPLGNGNNNSKI